MSSQGDPDEMSLSTMPLRGRKEDKNCQLLSRAVTIFEGSDDRATPLCRIRSYLSTLHKQARPLLEALVAVFCGHPFPIALSLG